MNINELIKEVTAKYMPLFKEVKRKRKEGEQVTEEEELNLFELSTKLELFKLIKTIFMEKITKDEGGKITDYFVKNNLITFRKEKATDKNGNEVEVDVVNESMDERIAMFPEEIAREIFEEMVKAHKKNVESYKNNKELLMKELYELDVINSFLPKEATKEDVIAWLNENYPNGITQKEMGPTIGAAKKAFERADGKMVSECVRSIIHN